MAFLHSRCQVCSLPSLGNKSALIKRLHEHFHSPSNDQTKHDTLNNPTAPSTGNNPTTSHTQQRAGHAATSHPNPAQQECTQQRVGDALISHSNHSQQTHASDNSSVSLPQHIVIQLSTIFQTLSQGISLTQETGTNFVTGPGIPKLVKLQ